MICSPSPIDSSIQAIDFGISTAAYVHIPFCRRRCYYCDFPVAIVGDRPPLASQGETQFGAIDQYLDELLQEIHITPQSGKALDTVFFGGGTPSLLSVRQLETILAALSDRFGLTAAAEVSIEIDPDTFDRDTIAGYRSAGVNRFSLGVQAFQPELLTACGRTHTPFDIDSAVSLIREVGIRNFSLDLISGLPQQTLDHWRDSLQQAIALEPSHLSVYDLIVEPMTAFGRWYQPGESPLPSDETAAEMYRLAQQILTQAGYQHYEISNYARSGYQCRHNRVYWENRPYFGFGMGAASYIAGQRFTRPRKRRDYFSWVQALVEHNGRVDCAVTPHTEVLLDDLMLGLRLAEGVDMQRLRDRFGDACVIQILQIVQPFERQNWVAVLDRQGERIKPDDSDRLDHAVRLCLTDPEGFLFSNVVLTALFEQVTPAVPPSPL